MESFLAELDTVIENAVDDAEDHLEISRTETNVQKHSTPKKSSASYSCVDQGGAGSMNKSESPDDLIRDFMAVKVCELDQWIDDLDPNVETPKPVFKSDEAAATGNEILLKLLGEREAPELKLFKFSGVPLEWPKFVERFYEVVHSKPHFTDSRRMGLLIGHLTGQALALVEGLGVSGRAYAIALKELKRRFAHPTIVTRAHLESVTNGNQIMANDRNGLETFYTRLRDCNYVVIRLGHESEIVNPENVRKAVRRLPRRLQESFAREAASKRKRGTEPTLRTMEYWLSDRVYALFDPVLDDISGGSRGGGTVAKTFSVDAEDSLSQSECECDPDDCDVLLERSETRKRRPRPESDPQKKCYLHPGTTSHTLMECKDFLLAKSSAEKKSFLALHSLCTKCYGEHTTERCTKERYGCKEPGCKSPKDHNTSLHAACLEHVLSNSVENLERPPESVEDRRMLEKHLGLCTLRPSHQVFVKGRDGNLIAINAMYDSGATLSQVCTGTMDRCNLLPVNRLPQLMVRTAGEKVAKSWGTSPLYVLPLHSGDGSLVAEVQCVGVTYIGTTDRCDVSKARELFGEKVTGDPLSAASGAIDLLIGNNHPHLFPQPIHVVDSVIWAETLFGPIVHGSHSNGKSGSSLMIGECLNLSTAMPLVIAETDDFVPRGSEITSVDSVASIDLDDQPDCLRCECKGIPLGESADRSAGCETLVNQTPTTAGISRDFERWTREEDLPVCFHCDRCVSRQDHLSKEDKRKLKVYKDCLVYDEANKRFVTKMPWKSGLDDIPDNKPSAVARLLKATERMKKEAKFRDLYVSEFEKAITDGVLVEVSEEEDRAWKGNGNSVWYLQHFPVVNENSESTPLRVIMDPTSSYKGVAVSDLWESPPNLVPRIDGLLLQFRAERVPISMDVKRAYRTIWLGEIESHMHRVVWNRLDENERVRVYKMTRNSWGSSPAGAIMSIAMHSIAERYRSEFPHVYNFVVSQIYVDDGIFSVCSVEEAVKLAVDVSYVMAQASFQIKYFIIGGLDVDVSSLDREKLGIPEHVCSGKEEERVIGVKWFTREDKISLSCRVNFSKKRRGARVGHDLTLDNFDDEFPMVITPRMYMSVMMSLYDVCGLATPVSVMLKHELGRICVMCETWDDPLPEGTDGGTQPSRLRCQQLIKLMLGVGSLKFERCLKPLSLVENTLPVLCIFADSSQTAFGAVVYVNWETTTGKRVSRLLMSKSKPLPKKPPLMSIPRAELMGMVFASRLLVFIRRYLNYEYERIVLMSDSTIALGQVGRDPASLKTWAAGKVEEVVRNSELTDWYHVTSELNEADVCTRGLDPSQMGLTSRWQSAPVFLAEPVETWPLKPRDELGPLTDTTESRVQDPYMSLKRELGVGNKDLSLNGQAQILQSSLDGVEGSIMQFLLTVYSDYEIDPSDSWYRMCRRVARIIRCLETFRGIRAGFKKRVKSQLSKLNSQSLNKRLDEISFAPTKREMELAKLFWIRLAQRNMAADFMDTRRKKINPVLGDDNVWRALGRTQSADHQPVILSSSNPLARVLIQYYHRPGHYGADTTWAKLTQHYWIIGGRVLTNAVVRECATCCALRKRAVQVRIAPKRVDQVTRGEVFKHVMIDLAGPYMTKSGKRSTRAHPDLEAKVWVLLVVCVSSGAVHLEMVESYSTADLLVSLKVFTHFRGKPERITADLGSQMVGAAGVLEPMRKILNTVQLQNLDPDCITWDFIPSGAHSSLGGVERMVKIFKDTMNALTGSRKPVWTKIKFSRLLYEIMDLMNDRPLAVGRTYIGKLDATRLIRPNDLIMGRSTTDVSKFIPSEMEANLYGSSKHLRVARENEAFVESFWERWRSQVFYTLLPAEKWQKSGSSLNVGDVVLVRDTNAVRGTWTLAQVTELHRSCDQLVRTATVRYKEPVKSSGSKRVSLYVTSKSKFALKSVRDLVVISVVNGASD